MVWKIRDKSLFWTKSGWKNNWEPRILNMPRPVNTKQTSHILIRSNHHSFLRAVQSYRNYSRLIKQYLYGDKFLEAMVLNQLRVAFRIPFDCTTPVELVKHGPQRKMADQLDRDLELISHNYHPQQLYLYQVANKKYRDQTAQLQRKQRGEQSHQQILSQQVNRLMDQEQSRLGPGQTIPLEKISQIFMRISKNYKQSTQNNSVRGKDGEFNDYMEKRRPFTNPHPQRVGH